MKPSDIPRIRLSNQRLIERPFAAAEDIVRWLGAVQAQDYPGAKWGIAQRVKANTEAGLDAAYNSGRILRTHAMRPTWHFVAPEDIRWLQALTAPRVRAAIAYYDRVLDLDESVLNQAKEVITNALRDGNHLTRVELGQELTRSGIVAKGQRLAHIVMHAELDALICSGAMRGSRHTYALVDERAPGAIRLHREEALAELTKRYFSSHGPAQVQDFSWWSGLTVAEVKTGIELAKASLVSEAVEGKTYWSAPQSSVTRLKDPTVHLLPNYDEYLIAYKDRSAFLDSSAATPRLFNDVFARHIIVLNGRVIGGWRPVAAKGATAAIEAQIFTPLSQAQEQAFQAQAGRYAQFLGMPLTVEMSLTHAP